MAGFMAGNVTAYLKLNTTGWTGGIQGANASLQSLARTSMRVGAVLLADITLIMREYGKFDKAIRHATSVSDLSQEQFEQMSKMALDASIQWNKAASETAQAFYYLGSAGLTATEQMDAFNQTIMLSRAMGSDLAQTVEGLVDVVKAFRLEFEDTARIADILTKTVISSNQHFSDLDKALSYAGATAAFTNNTLEETTAMLGVMANAGIKGSMAGTVLRRALANLVSPSVEMRDLIYQLGVNVYDSTGKMRPFIDIMGQMSDAMAGTSEEFRNMVFKIVFGVRAIGGQIALFNYGSRELRRYANEIKNAAGITEKVAGKQMLAFTEQLGQLWRMAQKVAIVLGDTLAPAILKVVDRLKYNTKALEDYIKRNADVVAESLKWVTVIGVLAITIPPLLLMVTGLTNQFLLLASAVAKSAIALALNPITYLVGALYVLRATLMQDFWKKAWENQIKPFFENFGKMGVDTIAQIMWEISLIPLAMKKAFSKSLEFVIDWATQMKLFLEGFMLRDIDKLAESIKMGNERIKKLLEPGLLGISWMDLFEGDDEARKASYNKYLADLKIVGEELLWTGKEMGEEFGDMMSKAIEEDVGHITSLMTKLAEKMPAPFMEAIKKITNAFNELKNIYSIFMEKPPKLPGVQMPKMLFEASMKEKQWLDDILAQYDKYIAEVRKSMKQPSIWAEYWKMGIRTVINEARTWQDVFADVNASIKDGWADTISSFLNDTYDGARTFKNIMTDMFDSVRMAFNKFVAEVLAFDLWYELFGQGLPIMPGRATFFHKNKIISGSGGFSYFTDLFSRFGEMDFSKPKYTPYTPYTPINAGEGLGMFKPVISFNLNNQTTVPVTAKSAGTSFNGKQWVVDVVLEEMRTNRGFAEQIRRG